MDGAALPTSLTSGSADDNHQARYAARAIEGRDRRGRISPQVASDRDEFESMMYPGYRWFEPVAWFAVMLSILGSLILWNYDWKTCSLCAISAVLCLLRDVEAQTGMFKGGTFLARLPAIILVLLICSITWESLQKFRAGL